MNDYINIYKSQLDSGNIQKAYTFLLKYVMSLKSKFSESSESKFNFGNVSPGYMDYSYFPFFNEFLRDRKLRFGIVLNHENMRFELWLMGQNSHVKEYYWNLFKSTKWVNNPNVIHKYAILDIVLVENPDFNNLDSLTRKIKKETSNYTKEILRFIENV